MLFSCYVAFLSVVFRPLALQFGCAAVSAVRLATVRRDIAGVNAVFPLPSYVMFGIQQIGIPFFCACGPGAVSGNVQVGSVFGLLVHRRGRRDGDRGRRVVREIHLLRSNLRNCGFACETSNPRSYFRPGGAGNRRQPPVSRLVLNAPPGRDPTDRPLLPLH